MTFEDTYLVGRTKCHRGIARLMLLATSILGQ